MTAVVSKPRRWRRRISVVLLIAALVMAVAHLVAMPMARNALRQKLQALVSDYLYARLDMGTITYRFPYGVEVDSVAIVTTLENQPPVTLASFRKLYLQLGELPIGSGPLVIETIDFDAPTIHVIRTADGIVGEKLARPRDSGARRRLSDVLQLSHLQISNGRVQFDDRTVPGSVPLVWDHLNLKIEGRRLENQADYQFDWIGSSGDLADITAAGVINTDTGVLKLDRLLIDAQLTGSPRYSPLPADVQAALHRLQITGKARLESAGTLPLGDVRASEVTAKLAIENAQGVLPNWREAVRNLALVVEAKIAGGTVEGQIARFDAQSTSLDVAMQPLDFILDPAASQWSLSPLRLTAAFNPSPPHTMFRQPAKISLIAQPRQGDSPTELQLDLAGSTLAVSSLDKPLLIAGLLRQDGPIVTGQGITINGVGGQAWADGTFQLPTSQIELYASFANIDARQIKRLIDPAGNEMLSGQLHGKINATMAGQRVDTLVADGNVDLTHGDFGKVPVLANLAKHLRLGEGLFTARDASATFKVANKIVTLPKLSISSSALRIRGTGTIGFDRAIDLAVYAGTASDWGAAVRETKIPLLSQLGGAIAGDTQGVIRSATKQITSFKVTGTLDSPKVTPTPLPVVERLWAEK